MRVRPRNDTDEVDLLCDGKQFLVAGVGCASELIRCLLALLFGGVAHGYDSVLRIRQYSLGVG